MEFKVITFLAVLCTMQGMESKGLNPFFGFNPFMAAMAQPIDLELRPIVSEIQMRLQQAQAVAKSAIGMNVGLASKNIGLTTSQAKTTVKALINSLQANPNTTKDCMSLSKPSIEQLNTESKSQLSYCSKSSQMQLKSLNQVQKELSFQAATLNQELNMAVNQCKLENPLPTDTAAVTDCVTVKADQIKEKLTTLEQTILDSVQGVDNNIGQIVNNSKTCAQQVQQAVQQEAETIADQLDQCSANPLTAV